MNVSILVPKKKTYLARVASRLKPPSLSYFRCGCWSSLVLWLWVAVDTGRNVAVDELGGRCHSRCRPLEVVVVPGIAVVPVPVVYAVYL
jgi:hypothetical protein